MGKRSVKKDDKLKPKSADATTTEKMRQKQQESRQALGEMSEMVDCASKGTTSKAKFTVCAIAKLGAPLVLLRLVWLTLTNALINMDKGVDAVEYFAGMKAVTKGYLPAGYSCCSFEKNDAWDAQDFCSDNGFALAVLLALKVEPAGAALAAPVCSSWIVLNVGTSGRAPHRPLGNAWLPYVAEANMMITRLVLLLLIFSSKSVWWVVEQPCNSMMQHHPRWQWLMRTMVVYRHSMKMLDFNAPSSKPHWLYSNKPWVAEIDLYKPTPRSIAIQPVVEMTKSKYTVDGKRSFSGGKDMKSSQQYPPAFGHAVASVYTNHRAELKMSADNENHTTEKFIKTCGDYVMAKVTHSDDAVGLGAWHDAKLEGVMKVVAPC